MNIHAEEGAKVIVTEETIKNGYNADKEIAEKYLVVGGIYTIDYTNVHDWNTSVRLKEFPKELFDSVSFEDYVEPKAIEPETKLGAEDFLRSKGWDDKNPIFGGAIFKTVASVLNDYAVHLNN